MTRYKRVLSIAGSDSGGGAGIQADIKTISANGCFATTAITSVTAQNTAGIVDIYNLSAAIVRNQIRAVLDDIGTDAVKIGMLPTVEIVKTVVSELIRFKVGNIVLDPVMVATSGDELIPKEAADAIIALLMPIATVITPNIPEMEYITKCRIASEEDFYSAAKILKNNGAQAVLLKSGHLDAPTLTDYLWDKNGKEYRFRFDKIDTPNTHGTGCTLSSAIASHLASGLSLPEAVATAENYVHGAIVSGSAYHTGSGHGPVHHFFKFWK